MKKGISHPLKGILTKIRKAPLIKLKLTPDDEKRLKKREALIDEMAKRTKNRIAMCEGRPFPALAPKSKK